MLRVVGVGSLLFRPGTGLSSISVRYLVFGRGAVGPGCGGVPPVDGEVSDELGCSCFDPGDCFGR